MPSSRTVGRPDPRSRRGVSGAARALLLAASATGWPAAPAVAAEPLSAWLDGLGDAAQRLAEGDAAASLAAARAAQAALPHGRAGARAAASVGLAHLEGGAPGLAVAPLQAALEDAATEARPGLQLALGQALLAVGRPADAAEALDAAARTAPPRLARRARWLEGRALLAAGLLPQAVGRLEPLLREAPDDEEAWPGRLALAGACRALGRTGRALALYRALAIEEPDRPEGAAALAAMERWRAEGGAAPPLGAEERLARAERLLARGRHAEALADVERAAAAAPPATASRVSLQRALVLLAQGRHADAEALARPLTEADQPAGVRRSATWVLARAAARAGRTEAAVEGFQAVARLPGGFTGLPEARWRDLADEAEYLAAWLFHEAGDHRQASRRLEAFARATPGSRRADDARWFAAWSRLALGERAEARRALARLEAGPLADAALYWQGRLAPSAGAAAAFYRRAVAAGGDGWYAALAAARLAGSPAGGPAARPPDPPAPLAPLELPGGPAAPRLGAGAALLALGWRTPARAELDDLLRRRPPAAAAAALAELAAFAGEADLPFRAARDHLGRTRRTARWLYPDPLPGLDGLARAAGADPDLLRAVIRKESAFRPDARSAAGAIGLMQLVPATAARLAALAGAGSAPAPDLLDPEASAALGAHYLALLEDRFRGDAAALAAYNAGPGPAAGWARERAGRPLDEWVEAIPYKETRGYVKAVLAARQAYRALAGRPPDLDPDRPIEPPGEGAGF